MKQVFLFIIALCFAFCSKGQSQNMDSAISKQFDLIQKSGRFGQSSMTVKTLGTLAGSLLLGISYQRENEALGNGGLGVIAVSAIVGISLDFAAWNNLKKVGSKQTPAKKVDTEIRKLQIGEIWSSDGRAISSRVIFMDGETYYQFSFQDTQTLKDLSIVNFSFKGNSSDFDSLYLSLNELFNIKAPAKKEITYPKGTLEVTSIQGVKEILLNFNWFDGYSVKSSGFFNKKQLAKLFGK